MTSVARRFGISGAVLLAVAGCAPSPLYSSAAPPLRVCGTTMSTSAAGVVLFDVSKHSIDLLARSPGGDVYLLVAKGCSHGAVVSWTPAASARLVRNVWAQDGRSAAVVLAPSRSATLDVHVAQNGQIRTAHLPR